MAKQEELSNQDIPEVEKQLYQVNEDLMTSALLLAEKIRQYENPVGSGRQFTDEEILSGKHPGEIIDKEIEEVFGKMVELKKNRDELKKKIKF